MGIPVFISQVVAAATDTVQAGAGSVQALPRTQSYFLLSPKGTDGEGKSLLYQLKVSADASGGGVTWTFVLDANLKLKVTHNGGGAVDLTLGCGLAWNLGLSVAYPPPLASTVTYSVPTGAGGHTATYRSPWLWCPEMRVSDTGPSLFDPMTSPGIRTSAGSMSRAPDGTTSATKNGEQVEAVFVFTAVDGYHRAREPDLTYGSEVRAREAYETWWRLGPSIGRRFLFWRDKAGLIASALPAGPGGSNVAPTYVEYVPSADMRAAANVNPTAPGDLNWWNVVISCWLTENGHGAHLG